MTTTLSMESDPMLRDLNEKKLSFRKNVMSLAAELKDARSRLASQEQIFAHEIYTRQLAESKARNMEEEVTKLQRCLQEKDEQLNASSCSTEMYLQELDGLRSQLSVTQATAEASATLAQSAQSQCQALLRELSEKNDMLNEHGDRVNGLGEQIVLLQNELEKRELSQSQLKGEILRVENDIMEALSKAGFTKDSELRKILTDVSPKNIENLSKHLNAKDNEIARLREEIKILSAHWTNKTNELQTQLEKQKRTDQELKKRVLKLEFCLQESRSQMRKLQRMEERRDKALKDLQDQLASRQQNKSADSGGQQNFWENPGFKFVVSMSMLALVLIAKR